MGEQGQQCRRLTGMHQWAGEQACRAAGAPNGYATERHTIIAEEMHRRREDVHFFSFPLSSILFCLTRMAHLLEVVLSRHTVLHSAVLLLSFSIRLSLK
jgi:hypothetical protein